MLHADIKRTVRELHGLDKTPVRAQTAQRQPRRGQRRAVVIIEFVAVAVALGDVLRAVAALHRRPRRNVAGVSAEAERAALVDLVALAGHKVDDLVGAELVELAGVGVRDPGSVARELDDRDLHAEADAEVGNAVRPRVLRGGDHALDAAAAEAAGDQNAVHSGEHRCGVFRRDGLGVDPANVDARAVRGPRVAQRLGDGEIGVMKLGIFADDGDGNLALRVADALDHRGPLRHVRRGDIQPQLTADDAGEVGLLQHQRRGVKAVDGAVFDHAVGLYVAEQRNLLENAGIRNRLVAAQDDDVRRDAEALKLLDGVLGRLALVLVAAAQIGYERDMDEKAVFPPDLQRDLAHRLDEGLALDVADGAADLRDDDVRIRLAADAVDELLDLVRDVGDDLHRGAEILAAPLLVQHVPVDLARGEIGVFVQILVDEALVVAEVEVGLRAVLRDVDLAVLIGAHGAGVDIDVRVELLRRDAQTAHFEQPSEGRRRDALAQTGHNAASHKNILRHFHPSSNKKRDAHPRGLAAPG